MFTLPKFGAVLIQPQDVPKLRKATSLGAPNPDRIFELPANQIQHTRFNATIRGALVEMCGDHKLHIGSSTIIKNEPGYPPVRDKYEDSIILVTRADAPAGIDPLESNQRYKPNHQDEQTLLKALKKEHIPFKTNPFKTLYKEVYEV